MRGVNVGKHADTRAVASGTDAYPNTATAAAVLAAGFLGIRRAGQQNIVLCIQRGVAPGFQLAARNHDVAAVCTFVFAVRGDGEIVACVQRAACHRITLSMLL